MQSICRRIELGMLLISQTQMHRVNGIAETITSINLKIMKKTEKMNNDS